MRNSVDKSRKTTGSTDDALMKLKISHRTSYHYDEPVPYALQQLRLMPKSRPAQEVLSWKVSLEGAQIEVEYDDAHSNHVQLIGFEPGTHDIFIHCEGEVVLQDTHGVIGKHHGYMPLWMFRRATALTAPGAHLTRLIRDLEDDEDDLERLHALSSSILNEVRYEIGRTDATSTAEEALAVGHGVCQDHAHIFIAAARMMGFPARYVSGYLMMQDRVEQDATHAWAEAHVDGVGWVGFDVSNGISPDTRYVRVATGLDYSGAAPISGMRYGTGDERMQVGLEVQQQ